jgi:hypothetical protein
MIRNLPIESATISALRGGAEFRGWGVDRYLSAALIDAVQNNTYAFVSANSKRRPKPPEPMERPGKKKQTGGNTFAAMARRAHLANKQKAGK